MKKLLSFLAVAGLACSVLSGCVEDQGYVSIRGNIDSEVCDPSSDTITYSDEMYLSTQTTKNFVCFDKMTGVDDIRYSKEDPYYVIGVQLKNNMPTESPWKNSGSSGSGATLEVSADAVNIFLDEFVVECYSIDGEKKNCKGIDPFKKKLGNIVNGGGGGACTHIEVDGTELVGWGPQTDIVLRYYIKYHDSSNMDRETNKLYLTLNVTEDPRREVLDANDCKTEEDASGGDEEGNGEEKK